MKCLTYMLAIILMRLWLVLADENICQLNVTIIEKTLNDVSGSNVTLSCRVESGCPPISFEWQFYQSEQVRIYRTMHHVKFIEFEHFKFYSVV